MSLILPFLLLASASVPIQSPDQKVSITTPAIRAPEALRQISEKTGVPLQITQVLADEVLVISVKDVPLQALLDRIAATTGGLWTDEGPAKRLILDAAKAEAAEKAKLDSAILQIRKKLLEEVTRSGGQTGMSIQSADKLASDFLDLTNKLREAGDNIPGELWEKQMALTNNTPSGRLKSRVLASLDPRELALLPPNTKIVFSTAPTKMQRKLPSAAVSAMNAYASEHAIWMESLRRFPQLTQDESSAYLGSEMQVNKFKSPPAKLVMSLYRWDWDLGMNIEMYVVDANGKILSQHSSSLGIGDPQFGFEHVATGGVAPAKSDEKPIQLSRTAMIVMGAMQGSFIPQDTPAFASFPAEMQEMILNPDKNDPLNMGPAEIVAGIAQATDANLVANLSDDMFNMVAMSGGARLPSALKRFMSESRMAVLEEKEGWLTIAPPDLADARNRRTDRSALATIAKAIVRNGSASIDDIGEYAVRVDDPTYRRLGFTFLSTFFQETLASMDLSSWELLRFWGLSSASQRQAMANKQPLVIGSMSQDQRKALTQLVFFKQNMSSNSAEVFEVGEDMEVDPEGGFDLGTIFNEPTEALPNGLPTNGAMLLDKNIEDVLVPLGQGYGTSMTASDIGTQMAMRERPDLYPWINEMPSYDKFKMSHRASYTFTLKLTPRFAPQNYLFELQKSKYGAQVFTFATLPADLKKEAEKARAEMREAQKSMKAGDMGDGGGTGGGPPPRP